MEYKIENSKKRLSLSINGKSLPINNASSVTDCRDIHRAGRDYFIKIGLYEKEVAPGYRIAYKNFALKQL